MIDAMLGAHCLHETDIDLFGREDANVSGDYICKDYCND